MTEPAIRGKIYETHNYITPGIGYMLVVSNNRRANDKYVSALVFGDVGKSRDAIEIEIPELGIKKYVHCGLVTSVKREYLLGEVAELDAETMHKIDESLKMELGL